MARSLQNVALHPAYESAGSATRGLLALFDSEAFQASQAAPEAVAAAMYAVAAGGGPVPLHLPLGPDSWGLIDTELKAALNAHGALRDVASLGVSGMPLDDLVKVLG